VVQYQGLPCVHGRAGPALPEPGFAQHARQKTISPVHGAQQAGQKPTQPRRDVERAALGGFQRVVILFAFVLHLGAEAVEALQCSLCVCQPNKRAAVRERFDRSRLTL